MDDYTKNKGIWIEIARVRRQDTVVFVQLKGDREDREAIWWPINSTVKATKEAEAAATTASGAGATQEQQEEATAKSDAAETQAGKVERSLFDGIDKNRLVVTRLEFVTGEDDSRKVCTYLACTSIRTQSAESSLR